MPRFFLIFLDQLAPSIQSDLGKTKIPRNNYFIILVELVRDFATGDIVDSRLALLTDRLHGPVAHFQALAGEVVRPLFTALDHAATHGSPRAVARIARMRIEEEGEPTWHAVAPIALMTQARLQLRADP